MVARIWTLARAAVGVLAIGAAGCGSSVPAAGSSPVGSPTRIGAAASSPSKASCSSQSWRSAPITVTRQVAVPPVPVIKDVRVAQHPDCGYDRVVLDVTGQVPGYSVRYVAAVVADASGRAIAIPGARYLLITLRPAQAHNGAGVPTMPSAIQLPGYPAVASWVVAGDFEGAVKIALGLGGQASVRSGELPGRIYLDIRE